jgi:hypothetical protein
MYVAMLTGTMGGVKLLFAVGYGNANKAAQALLMIFGGLIVFGIPAFVWGWLTGEKDANAEKLPPSRPQSSHMHSGIQPSEDERQPSQEVALRGKPRVVARGAELTPHPHTDLAPHAYAALSASSDAVTASGDEELWARALLEFESQNRRPGLWAKSFAEAGGNEAAAKAGYLTSRVLELQQERRAAVFKVQETARQQEAEKRATIEKLKRSFLGGARLRRHEVSYLARMSVTDASLVGLWERFQGETLLHGCARYGLLDEANILIKGGASIASPNGSGQTPFDVAEDPRLKETLEIGNQPKGRCPNPACNAIILLSSQGCAKCGASFETGSAWKVTPISGS